MHGKAAGASLAQLERVRFVSVRSWARSPQGASPQISIHTGIDRGKGLICASIRERAASAGHVGLAAWSAGFQLACAHKRTRTRAHTHTHAQTYRHARAHAQAKTHASTRGSGTVVAQAKQSSSGVCSIEQTKGNAESQSRLGEAWHHHSLALRCASRIAARVALGRCGVTKVPPLAPCVLSKTLRCHSFGGSGSARRRQRSLSDFGRLLLAELFGCRATGSLGTCAKRRRWEAKARKYPAGIAVWSFATERFLSWGRSTMHHIIYMSEAVTTEGRATAAKQTGCLC